MAATLIPLVLLLAFMWLLLIRPQQQRVRSHQALVQSLEVGDEVVTAGGIFGKIRLLDGDEIQLEVAPGTTIRVLRAAINRRVSGQPEVGPGESFDDERGAE